MTTEGEDAVPEIVEPANARSRRTRQALLDAALAIIEEQGFDGLTMGAIGQRAGVSRRGVYLHFDSVGALMTGLFDHVAQREGLATSVAPVWEAAHAAAAVDAWARHLADYHCRVLVVDRAIQRAEASNAAAAAHRATVSAAQEANCRRLAQRLADDGALAEGWSVATATDLLFGLISNDLFGRLLDDRRWSRDQLADRLSLMLRSTLVRSTGHTHA